MKKIYLALLSVAMLLTSMSVKGANQQFYHPGSKLFYEVTSTELKSSIRYFYLVVIGIDQYGRLDTISSEIKQDYRARKDFVIPGRFEETSGGVTGRFIVEGVAQEAFIGNDILETVTFDQDLTGLDLTIGRGAFANCQNLKSVSFDNRKTISIGQQAFFNCQALETVTFPSSVSNGISIGKAAFMDCKKLDICNYGTFSLDNVTSIGNGAFSGCTASGAKDGLNSLTIPETVTSLGADILQGTQVKNMQIDCPFTTDYASAEQSPFYSIREQIEYVDMSTNIGTKMPAYLCYGMKNADIDYTCFEEFGAHCFEGCEHLSTVGFTCAKSIGDSALAGLDLKRVNLPEVAPTTLGKNAFGNMAEEGASTLFVIYTDVCDEEALEDYASTHDDLMALYFEGRLIQRGDRKAPSFQIELRNAKPASGTGISITSSYGGYSREPLCGMNSIVLYMREGTHYVAKLDGDTIQYCPFSHFEYDGKIYYSGDEMPLSDDATLKVTTVYSPIIISDIELRVKLPETGDVTDGTDLEFKVSDDAGYNVTSWGLNDSDGNAISTPIELQPNTQYIAFAIVEPRNLEYSFPVDGDYKIDKSGVTPIINEQADENNFTLVAGTNSLLVARRFTTGLLPEGIEDVQSDKVQCTKVLRDGQLIIIRDGKEFNAQGIQL